MIGAWLVIFSLSLTVMNLQLQVNRMRRAINARIDRIEENENQETRP